MTVVPARLPDRPEVDQLGHAVVVEHDVCRLDVAVGHAPVVEERQGGEDALCCYVKSGKSFFVRVCCRYDLGEGDGQYLQLEDVLEAGLVEGVSQCFDYLSSDTPGLAHILMS